MLSLLLAFAALPPPQPQERVFDDWAVACDNVRRCEATVMQAPEQFGTAPSQLLLTREPGPKGAFSIAIDPAELVEGEVTLLVDGKPVTTGVIGENYRVSGAPATTLAKAMAAGNWLELRSGAKLLARISLAGLSGTLRYIEAEQGNGRTIAALPAVPALRAAKIGPDSPSSAVLGELAKLGDCDVSATPADLPVERYRLDGQTTLVLVPCGASAYNYSSAAFVLRGGKGAPAEFDVTPNWSEGDGPGILTNASFSTLDGAILTSSQKGRGLGDCGTAQRWVWDGSRFRMIEARGLGECRGSINWLTLFRATPDWR